MFVYFFIFLFLVWNMWMASSLTIPLYKLMCNLSYLDIISNVINFLNKELNIVYFLFFYNNTFFFCDSCNNEYSFYIYLDNKIIYNLNNNGIENVLYMNIERTQIKLNNISIDSVFEIKFFSKVSNFSVLEFISLQDSILMYPGETGLVFFRLFNPTMYELTGMSLYFIYPNNVSIYINKIQCFCFDLINVRNNETIELPILFFLDKLLLFDNNIFDRLIYISYIFFLK